MSELTDLLSLIGLTELLDDPEDESEASASNYLLEGKRILSLARNKKKRNIFKEENLTVRLCDLKYPLLADNEIKVFQQIENTIKKVIKKELKKVTTREYLIEQGIPFILKFCEGQTDYKIGLPEMRSEERLSEDVSKSQHIITLKIANETFYIPCNPNKRFKNSDYYYRFSPQNSIHMLHTDTAFFALWGICWLNQLKRDSLSDSDISGILKYLLHNISGCLRKCNWEASSIPEWYSNFLIDSGYVLDKSTNYYTLPNEYAQAQRNMCYATPSGYVLSNTSQTARHCLYSDSESVSLDPEEKPMQLSDFNQELIKMVSFVYGDTWLSAKDLLHENGSSVFFCLPYYYEKYIFLSLRHFISNIQDIQEEEKHRKKLDGMVARAYMTKRNIPQKVLAEMQNSELNQYFGFIEFDEEVDLKSVDIVTKEFQKLNQHVFHNFKSKDVALRFRKLGRHHASGLYYPSINTMVVDFRHPDSFVHEYFHMLDDTLGNLSLQYTFDKVAACYQKLVRKTVEDEQKQGTVILSSKGKYNINYYLRKCEIFARCGEIYLFRNLHIVSSLLKPEETKYFAYPDDDILNQYIDEYYTSLFNYLKDLKIDKRKDTYETTLHLTA